MIDKGLIKEALEIIKIIENAGYEAYIVGGSLRDSLLGTQPKDIDIATSALPEDIKKIFQVFKTIDTGIEFGTVTLIYKGSPIEITTFRSEALYTDSRRPDKVEFQTSIIEDLKRRDFTINAMAYSEKTKLIDLFSGKEDLQARIIKCVGNPEERFTEDALRMLRAVRFASVLDFEIEQDTFLAIRKLSSRINYVSKERIQVELSKILLSRSASRGIKLLLDLNLLEYILPEIAKMKNFNQHNPFHHLDLLNHTLCVIDKVNPSISLRLAALFHDAGKVDAMTIGVDEIGHFYGHDELSEEIAKTALASLKYSNEIIDNTCKLVRHHMIQSNEIGKKGIQKLLRTFGTEQIYELVDLHYADSSCTALDTSEDVFRAKIDKAIDEKLPFSTKDLHINGYDLMELGAKGKQIGDILNQLLEMVCEDASLNNKEQLLEFAKEIL